jgi:hypothetical protein
VTADEVLKHAIHVQTGEGYRVAVVKKAADPQATRISCGGVDGRAYCTYRGTLEEAIEVTRNCLAALMALEKSRREPLIAPDAGKEYA